MFSGGHIIISRIKDFDKATVRIIIMMMEEVTNNSFTDSLSSSSTVATALAEEARVSAIQLELLATLSVVAVLLIFVIVWLCCKLFGHGEISIASRASSQSSLSSTASADSPYQWRTLNVVRTYESGPIYNLKQNKTIQRLLDVRSTGKNGSSSVSELIGTPTCII